MNPDSKRPDWYVWPRPDPAWCRLHAEVPGLQFAGDGKQITLVTLHKSHLPLVPAEIKRGMGVEGMPGRLGPWPPSLLRSYQAEDLPFLLTRRGSLLAYQMRLGKTVTACHAHDPRDGMLVVVGPLASRDVWKTWIERVHGFPPLVLQGRKDAVPMPGYPAYFVHYDILDAHTKFFAGERTATLVLDEVHLLQNRKAQRTAAASVLTTRAARIIGLSGTPMWANPDSLYSVLHLITPGAWGGHHAWGVRYCGAHPGSHGWDYSGVSHEDELQARLSEVMVRRTWKDVVADLPPTTRVVEPVDVPLSKLAEIEAATMQVVLARGTSTVVGYLATLRRKLAAVKIGAAVSTAARAGLDGHKVVVWVWHVDVGDKIAAELTAQNGLAVFRLRAEDNADAREATIRAFHDCPLASVLVAGIAVGGIAIDLSCSDYAVFAELDWTPAMVFQAEMRTFSPARPHVVVYLYADVPVEHKLVDALGLKEDLASKVGLGFDRIAEVVLHG